MDVIGVCERVRGIVAATSATDDIDAVATTVGLRAVTEVRAWLDAQEATLTGRLAAAVPFPEKVVADCTRSSLRAAQRLSERSASLARLPNLAASLSAGTITAGHVDTITQAARRVDGALGDEFFERADALVHVAEAATVPEFRRRVAMLVASLDRTDGMDRLERQRRATTLHTWTDHEGMWCLEGRFDPVTGVRLSARLDAAVHALFAEATPDTSPQDPMLKQRHLQALALARLLSGDGAGFATLGRPEIVVVVHTDADDTAGGATGGPVVDWGLPVEIPAPVLADLAGHADVHAVVVRNGVVLHAPGQLDLGRSTRLANRAQRRALRALYATCAIPGCEVRFDRCKIHHVMWWRHGGGTDLDNLVPLCPQHHVAVHDRNWHIVLGPGRELTLTLPDGTIHNTGPPDRRAA